MTNYTHLCHDLIERNIKCTEYGINEFFVSVNRKKKQKNSIFDVSFWFYLKIWNTVELEFHPRNIFSELWRIYASKYIESIFTYFSVHPNFLTVIEFWKNQCSSSGSETASERIYSWKVPFSRWKWFRIILPTIRVQSVRLIPEFPLD